MRRRFRQWMWIGAVGCLLTPLHAQYRTIPPGRQWQTIPAGMHRIIYPPAMEAKARRIAGLITTAQNHPDSSIGFRARPIDLYILNTTAIPNGYVRLIPRYSMFYAMPFYDRFAGPIDWLDLLAIHEYRHVRQFDNTLQGFTKLIYWLYGESGWGLTNVLTTPNWYYEGDATVEETLRSLGGRGRQSTFMGPVRAIADRKRLFSYDKVRMDNSYKDYLPNAYQLGYVLTAYGRTHFGNDLWARVIRRTMWWPFRLYPFSTYLKKATEHRTPHLYKAAFTALRDTLPHNPTPHRRRMVPQRRVPTSHYRPIWINDREWAVLRSSYDEPATVYLVDSTGRMRRFQRMGVNINDWIDARGRWIVWEAFSLHPRWTDLSYSDIYVYDIQRRALRQLTSGQRFSMPVISPDQGHVAAIQTLPNGNARLVILDIQQGTPLRSIDLPDDISPAYPRWESGQFIAFVAVSGQRNRVMRWNLVEDRLEPVTPWTSYTLRHLHSDGKYYYWSADFDAPAGNIYAYDPGTHQMFRLTNARYYANAPNVNPRTRRMLYTSYAHNDLAVYELPLDSAAWVPTPFRPVQPLPRELQGLPDTLRFTDDIPISDAPSKPFREASRWLTIHSWGLQYTSSTKALSVGVSSIDPLKTWKTSARLGYVPRADSGGGYAITTLDVQYSGAYPVIRGYFGMLRQGVRPEVLSGVDVYVPLRYIRHHRRFRFTPRMSVEIVSVGSGGTSPYAFRSVHPITSVGIDFSGRGPSALRNLSSAVEVNASARIGKLWNASSGGWILSGSGDFTGRGIHRNHSFQLKAAHYSQRFSDPYRNTLSYAFIPATVPSDSFDAVSGWQVWYHLPLFYPDLALRGIAYVPRVGLSGFYGEDRFRLPIASPHPVNRTAGVRLWAEVTALRLAPLLVSVEYAVLQDVTFGTPGKRLGVQVDLDL